MNSYRSNLSRRRFLATLSAAGSAILLGPDQLWSAEVDPRVAQIASKTIAIDMHNHVQIRFVNGPADVRPAPGTDLIGEMKRGGFSAICQTWPLDGLVTKQVGGYYQHFLQGLAFEDRLLASNGMRRALTMKDLETAHAQNQPIIVQSIEGAQFIEGRLERIEEAYKRGVRLLQILHQEDDLVKPLGDVGTAPPHLGGLTPFGAEVIRECNRIGMLVDLAHGTEASVMGALQAATQPFIISHTSLNSAAVIGGSAHMHGLLADKSLVRAVADAGGIVGVWWRMVYTTGEYVEGIKAMVDVAGIDHVGIGTDSDILSSYVMPYTNQIWPDQNGGFFYAVAGEMLKQGFTLEEIGKICGGNFCRVFAQATAVHA